MKVLYVTPFYNASLDGRFGRFTDWAHSLRDSENPSFEHGISAFITAQTDGTVVSSPHHLLGNGDELWGSPLNKAEYVFNIPRIIRDIRSFEPDIVHVMTLDSIIFPVARICATTNTQLVVGPDVQGYFPTRQGDRWNRTGLTGIRHRMAYRFRQALSSIAPNATYVTLSNYHQQNVSQLVGDNPVRALSPGVDSRFHPEEQSSEGDTFQVLYVGDLSEYKGYPLFLKSLTELPSDVSVEATVLGTGDSHKRMIQRLSLSNSINVVGFVERKELPNYYQKADLFVMPSVDENGPNTVVESLACGTPVAVTDRPGINEYHPPEAGITFERNAVSLRDAILEAIENRDAMRAAAREHAEEFDVSRTVEDLAILYEDIAG